jgi:hypothetical protein
MQNRRVLSVRHILKRFTDFLLFRLSASARIDSEPLNFLIHGKTLRLQLSSLRGPWNWMKRGYPQ